MNRCSFSFLIVCLLLGSAKAQNTPAHYVNPFVGTGGHGHTFPGATLPHGMVQLSPDTRLEGWDGCGGYHYSDSFVYGFSHTHLSGTGVSDYGDILLMPMQTAASPDNKMYGSLFNHKQENAVPGYYSVQLKDDDIFAEFTATERTGYHHYRFSTPKDAHIIVDLKHRDEVIESSITIEDSVTVTGMRRSKAWATNQYVFFVIRFSKPMQGKGIWNKDQLVDAKLNAVENTKNLKAFFSFSNEENKDLYVQVAISPVSVEGAKLNLITESLGKSFQEIKEAAFSKWNEELSKIEVKSPDTTKLRIFYTALYHTAIAPNMNMDVDGQYRGRDNQIHRATDFTYYSVFSLWDTYRATHPLFTIIDKPRTLDYIRTFLEQYKEGGRLPVWELASCETDCMIGYHSVPVITDAFVKGITGFDTKLALEAMLKSARWNHLGLPAFMRDGMVGVDDDHESVSKTLEYAYDDFCIAEFAKATGDTATAREFRKRAQYYKNVLDVKTGFMRPRKNGGWLAPFDPREVNNHFTEANSWQYSFYMPQDIDGYLAMTGGPKKLEQKLDQLFAASSATTGRNQSDITGLIGQYAHGNEPSHHIAYLYNYAGNPAKTQQLVHKILTEMYLDTPDGLIGNEDCGQMSAWYVISALGFYPVTPGTSKYLIGTPLFNLAEIRLENERSFIINAPGVSDTNKYIKEALLSTTASLMPKKWPYAWLDHADIAGGGLITLMMDKKSVNAFPAKIGQSITTNKQEEIVINPVINAGGIAFRGSKQVSISSPQRNILLYYTTDGTAPTQKSMKYTRPLLINKSVTIKAIAIDKSGNRSFVSTAVLNKIPHNWTVKLQSAYEPQYDGGGADGLIDGIRGTTNWRMGNWQGYQLQNLDAVIDLKKVKPISKVSIGFLQDTRSWIAMPSEVSVEVSVDGIKYELAYRGRNYLPLDNLEPQLFSVDGLFEKKNARYIRVRAKQYGKLPSWHEGAGGDTHIFVDEIIIE